MVVRSPQETFLKFYFLVFYVQYVSIRKHIPWNILRIWFRISFICKHNHNKDAKAWQKGNIYTYIICEKEKFPTQCCFNGFTLCDTKFNRYLRKLCTERNLSSVVCWYLSVGSHYTLSCKRKTCCCADIMYLKETRKIIYMHKL